MIAVTGVTGNLGRIVIEDLLTRIPASELVAVARTPSKAADLSERGVDVRAGSYDDPASLRAAFAGVDVLLLVSSPDITTPGIRPIHHGNAIDAAKAAGVGRIVYTSAEGAANGQGFLADHTTTEGLLRDAGVPHTILRNTFYMEALVNPGLRDVVSAGELPGADEGRPVNLVTIRDLALAAAATLTGPEHTGVIYELRGALWTVADLAATVADVTGSPVAYRAVPAADLGGIAFVHQIIASGLFDETAPDLEKLLGRPATTMREAVQGVFS
ncbi:NAD(P)H-binding protein [Pseudonocardia sp. GCM10023141]|uniref:NmrA family NAD(P)-binding protein n=1 Tax=Pseudonocardia sp. GCM10023141 TaxID=3252653 RepID=UPI0036113ABE